jgi:PAS domain S-box-containing protein
MKLAWVGVPDKDTGRLLPVCQAGAGEKYLKGLRIDLDGGPYSRSPMGQAALNGKISTSLNIPEDSSFAPWRERAEAVDFNSAVAIPLLENGKVTAVMGIYSSETDFFSADELKLLSEIQADLSLALEAMTDAEKRAEAQAALERTAAQLAHIMDVTPVILFRLAKVPPGRFSADWVSGNSEKLTGYTPAEMLSPDWWFSNIHPEDKERVMAEQRKAAGRKSLTQDFRFRKKDGTYVWIHSQMTLTGEAAGETTGSWTDITQLKESEARFQELFEKAPIGYQSLDEKANLLAVNDTWLETFGYTREEAVGHNYGDFLAQEYHKVFAENFPKFKASGQVNGIEFEIERKDGGKRHIIFNGRVAHNPDGSFHQTHCIFTDVTDTWKEARQRKILSEAIKASSNEIYVFDAATFHFIFANHGAMANLGYTPEELEGMTPWDIKPDFTEASFRDAVAPLSSGKSQALIFETNHRRKDGSAYPVEVRLQHISTPAGPVFLAVNSDITERKRAEHMVTEMANMQRVESLGALAGGIAHDFNNMLTGIMANLSLLSGKLKAQEEKDIIHDTLDAAHSAQMLTTQLLAFSKGGKPVRTEICLEKALRDIFNLATRGSNTASELAVSEDLWSVQGDENQLKQAINNLLVNGLQAMPAGGKLSLTGENMELAAASVGLAPGKYVRLLVRDTGIGIPKDYLPRIFEPYFTTKAKGHGLGLPMTWSVITNHGGKIIPSSEPGKGTQFEVFLPATGRCLKEEAQRAPVVSKGQGRILLLEDEEIVKKAALRMLTELGYSPEATSDGKDTLRRYKEEQAAGRPFAAVIMDLTIPGGLGGVETVKELRREFPEARVLVSSGYSDEAVMADYKTYGFDAMLPKPYRYEDLAATLDRLLKK